MAFRAEDDDEARAMIDDQEGGMRSDLKALVGADGKPLWDGKFAIRAQEATAEQHAEWEQSRDQAISDEEIDLNAGDDPDECCKAVAGSTRRGRQIVMPSKLSSWEAPMAFDKKTAN